MKNEKTLFFFFDNKNYTFRFEIKYDFRIVITAIEENFSTLNPKTYQNTFKISDFSIFEQNNLTDPQDALKKIILLFKNKEIQFTLQDSEIIITICNNSINKFVLNLPLLPSKDFNDILNTFSSKISFFNSLFNKYKYLITNLSKKCNKVNKEKNNDIFEHYIKQQKIETNQKFDSIQNAILQNQKETTLSLNNISQQISRNSDVIINNQQQIKNDFTEKLNFNISFLFKLPIKKIKGGHFKGINEAKYSIRSLCFLKDERLVSCSDDGKIVIYNKDTYQSEIIIQRPPYDWISSVYLLRNGNLLSSRGTPATANITIWEIKGNNYKILYSLHGHTSRVLKVIELEDGKLCSCSWDKTIRIWDNQNGYKCSRVLEGHTYLVMSVLEINNYIVSGSRDNSLRIWNKSTYECIKVIQDICCYEPNGLSKLKENTIINGGKGEIFIIDILSFKYSSIKNKELGCVYSTYVSKDGKVLLGDDKGKIFWFDEISNQITFMQNVNNNLVGCIIESEDSILFSSGNEIFLFDKIFFSKFLKGSKYISV